jgi:plastocyanin
LLLGRLRTFRSLVAGLGAALGVALVACAPAATSTSSGSGASGAQGTVAVPSPGNGQAPVVINMLDTMKFDPATVTVAVGTTVTWRNVGQTAHTATDDPSKAINKINATLPQGAAPWDSDFVSPGQTYAHTFTVPGTYTYFCIPHEALGMVGKVVVTP